MQSALRCIAVVAIAAAAVSCTKEFMDREELAKPQRYALGEPRAVSIAATSPTNSGADKLYVSLSGNSGRDVIWETGDVIRVNNANCTIHSVDPNNPTIGYFYPSSLAACTTAVSGKDVYYAVYPASIANTTYWGSSNSITPTITLPTRQTYVDVSTTNQMPTNYMAAYTVADQGSTDITLYFKNLCSMLVLPLKTSSGTINVSKICVRTTASASTLFNTTSGTLSFPNSNATAEPAVTATTDNTNRTVTLDCNASQGGVQLSSTAQNFVIMLPINSGTELSSGELIVEIYNSDSTKMTKKVSTLTGSNKLVRSKYYTSPVIEVTFDREGFIGGEFSVSATEVVRFSKGGLMWSRTNGGSTATTHKVKDGGTAAGTWKFAEHQWDFVGGAHSNTTYGTIGSSSNDEGFRKLNNNESYTGWIDLFGWGNSGCNNNSLPYNMGVSDATVSLNGTNYDWGYYNAISNGGDTPDIWRTPTMAEWRYLFRDRTNALQKIGYATITVSATSSVYGLVILPDNFTFPTTALGNSWTYFTANGSWVDVQGNDEQGLINTTSQYTDNTYSTSEWLQMENAGAIFLPANGFRSMSGYAFNNPNNGYYLSETQKTGLTYSCACYYSLFSTEKLSYMRNYAWEGYYGRGVRLVMK